MELSSVVIDLEESSVGIVSGVLSMETLIVKLSAPDVMGLVPALSVAVLDVVSVY